ncbi:MAG TPA: copper chaperone PCu(A)C [Dokdonella sp.]
MPHAVRRSAAVGLALLLACAGAHAEGRLGVTDAWIREAPPGAGMLAGYATLKNAGDAPISVLTVQSDAFRMASLHETIDDHGVAKMRELHGLDLAPGASARLQPGGMHLMLMQPRREVHAGEKVAVTFLLGDGRRVETYFDVVAADASGD